MASKSTENVPPLAVYLARKGVDETTSKEILEAHRKEHTRLYNRIYAQKRRADQVRMENRLSKAEFRLLQREAKAHNRKALSSFVKDCAFAYLEGRYLERNPELTQEVVKEVRKIGNNINQAVQVLHAIRAYQDAEKYTDLRDKVMMLAEDLRQFLQQPPTLEEYLKQPPQLVFFIQKVIQTHPEYLKHLEDLVMQLKEQYDNQKQDEEG